MNIEQSTIEIPVNLPSLPEEYPDYSSVDYWNSRFEEKQKTNSYEDWYLTYHDLESYLSECLKEDDQPNLEAEILVIGSGMSTLSEDIYQYGGFECITNIDFSQTLIDLMNLQMQGEKGDKFENMDYLCVDICNIEDAIEEKILEEDGYNAIVDKGVLDCIACDEDETKMPLAVENIWRMLMPGGFYFMVSRAQSNMRQHLFSDPNGQKWQDV